MSYSPACHKIYKIKHENGLNHQTNDVNVGQLRFTARSNTQTFLTYATKLIEHGTIYASESASDFTS